VLGDDFGLNSNGLYCLQGAGDVAMVLAAARQHAGLVMWEPCIRADRFVSDGNETARKMAAQGPSDKISSSAGRNRSF